MVGLVTPIWRPRTASCSCAAGRCTSSEASNIFLRPRCLRRLAILAAVVVLPEPCNPTSMITTGEASADSCRSLRTLATARACCIDTSFLIANGRSMVDYTPLGEQNKKSGRLSWEEPLSAERVEGRLAAILAVDIVGYSASRVGANATLSPGSENFYTADSEGQRSPSSCRLQPMRRNGDHGPTVLYLNARPNRKFSG
jgi:hypothetical protein